MQTLFVEIAEILKVKVTISKIRKKQKVYVYLILKNWNSENEVLFCDVDAS